VVCRKVVSELTHVMKLGSHPVLAALRLAASWSIGLEAQQLRLPTLPAANRRSQDEATGDALLLLAGVRPRLPVRVYARRGTYTRVHMVCVFL
jgi:hypothetical protein